MCRAGVLRSTFNYAKNRTIKEDHKMDEFYRGKNTRPKRRKYADFPYTIFTVEAENAEPQFYVRFVDGEGKGHCIALGIEL